MGTDLSAGRDGPRHVLHAQGDTLTTADQPVQPRAVHDLTHAGRELRGVLLTGLRSTGHRRLDDPVYFTPTVDLATTAPEVSAAPTSFPSALQSVSHYQSPTGRATRPS